MVHAIFQRVATRPGLVNDHAYLAIDSSLGRPFSEVFEKFFVVHGRVQHDVALQSWLDAISNGFAFNTVCCRM